MLIDKIREPKICLTILIKMQKQNIHFVQQTNVDSYASFPASFIEQKF